jgi:hypothetical protein
MKANNVVDSRPRCPNIVLPNLLCLAPSRQGIVGKIGPRKQNVIHSNNIEAEAVRPEHSKWAFDIPYRQLMGPYKGVSIETMAPKKLMIYYSLWQHHNLFARQKTFICKEKDLAMFWRRVNLSFGKNHVYLSDLFIWSLYLPLAVFLSFFKSRFHSISVLQFIEPCASMPELALLTISSAFCGYQPTHKKDVMSGSRSTTNSVSYIAIHQKNEQFLWQHGAWTSEAKDCALKGQHHNLWKQGFCAKCFSLT